MIASWVCFALAEGTWKELKMAFDYLKETAAERTIFASLSSREYEPSFREAWFFVGKIFRHYFKQRNFRGQKISRVSKMTNEYSRTYVSRISFYEETVKALAIFENLHFWMADNFRVWLWKVNNNHFKIHFFFNSKLLCLYRI